MFSKLIILDRDESHTNFAFEGTSLQLFVSLLEQPKNSKNCNYPKHQI